MAPKTSSIEGVLKDFAGLTAALMSEINADEGSVRKSGSAAIILS